MSCTNCSNEKMISVCSKSSDCNCIRYNGVEKIGYVIKNLNIGGGGYINFEFCPKCGKIDGDFPIEDSVLEEAFE